MLRGETGPAAGPHPCGRSRLARRRRRRRTGEMKSSLRLGVLLVGLVGVNVYVFFFNRKAAPRDVLNMQSTAKTMEVSRREILSADVRKLKTAAVKESAPASASAATQATAVVEAAAPASPPIMLARAKSSPP